MEEGVGWRRRWGGGGCGLGLGTEAQSDPRMSWSAEMAALPSESKLAVEAGRAMEKVRPPKSWRPASVEMKKKSEKSRRSAHTMHRSAG